MAATQQTPGPGPVVKLVMVDVRFSVGAALLAREKADTMYARQAGMVLDARAASCKAGR
jgi:hypothetical protein